MEIYLQSVVYDSVLELSCRLCFILSRGKVIIDRTVISFGARKPEVFGSNYKTWNGSLPFPGSLERRCHNSFFYGDLYMRFPIVNFFLHLRNEKCSSIYVSNYILQSTEDSRWSIQTPDPLAVKSLIFIYSRYFFPDPLKPVMSSIYRYYKILKLIR